MMLYYLGGAEVVGELMDIVALISLIIGALLDLLRLACCTGQSMFMAVSEVLCTFFMNMLKVKESFARCTRHKPTHLH